MSPHLVILNTSSFALVSRTLPRHSRAWWTHSWDTCTSFLFTSMTYWSSARTTKNTLITFDKCWQSWKTTSCLQGWKTLVLPEISWVFGTHHLLGRRSTFPRQAHCCQDLANPEKREDAAVVPGICELLRTNLSPVFPEFFTFDKVIDKKRCFWLEIWLPKCFRSSERLLAPWACSEASRPTRIDTDSSGYAVGAVLNQEHPDGWHLAAYLWRTMMASAEWNIQEEQLQALIYALKKWRHYLFGMEIAVILTTFLLLLGKPIGKSLEGNLVGSTSSVSFLSRFSTGRMS